MGEYPAEFATVLRYLLNTSAMEKVRQGEVADAMAFAAREADRLRKASGFI